MEPAGWATVAASLVAMFGVIAVALIQRAKNRPKQWNGVERRLVETITDEKITAHRFRCENMAEIRGEIKEFRTEVGKGFDAMNEMIDRKLEAIRTFIVQMHGKP